MDYETKGQNVKEWLAYRNKHWNPEKGQYYFSEQYVYAYKGVARRTFSFYYDPLLELLCCEKVKVI